jgi:hypothetical protein
MLILLFLKSQLMEIRPTAQSLNSKSQAIGTGLTTTHRLSTSHQTTASELLTTLKLSLSVNFQILSIMLGLKLLYVGPFNTPLNSAPGVTAALPIYTLMAPPPCLRTSTLSTNQTTVSCITL